MSTTTLGLFLRHLALSDEVSALAAVGDRELLDSYESGRGQAAFTELMRRYGPMVLRTCRRVLGHGPDAEDAFQATFLILARKVGPLRRESAGRLSLGGWLHRVAYQTALNVLAQVDRRKVREQQARASDPQHLDPVAEATWNEVRPVLDAELNALPDEDRRLLISCYLQGKTHAETAAELGLPLGSVARRLEKACAVLAKRLARRGITVSVTTLGLLLDSVAWGGGVPAALMVHSVEAVMASIGQADEVVVASIACLTKSGSAILPRGSAGGALAYYLGLAVLGVGLLACCLPAAWTDPRAEGGPPEAQSAGRPQQESHPSALTDRFGDPLPPGSLARLGTVRFRHVQGVHSLAFTPDGKGLITAGKGDPARLWDAATGRVLRQFGGSRDGRGYAAALSPDGRIVAGGGGARPSELCLWDAATGALLRQLEGGTATGLTHLAFSPDGKTILAGDERLRLWEVATGKGLWTSGQVQVASLAYSADGKTLIWGGFVGDLHFLEARTGREVRRWDDEHKRPLWALVPASDGRLLTARGPCGAAKGCVGLWDVNGNKEVWHEEGGKSNNVNIVAISPDGKAVAAGSMRGPLRLLNAATGKEFRRLADCQSALCLAFSPDGKALVSGDQAVHWWNVGAGREARATDEGHQATVCSVAFTTDGKDIVSGSWEGSLRAWDSTTGEQRRQISPADDERFITGAAVGIGMVSEIAIDGKVIVKAAWERHLAEDKSYLKVRRWARNGGQELGGWSGELGNWAAHSLVISPDGSTVVCALWKADPDQALRWDAATGRELPPVAGHFPAFSPDGKLLATAPFVLKKGEPGTFTLWEAATARALGSVPVPEGHVHRLLFSPDGRVLATASHDADNRQSVVHLWPLLREGPQGAGVRVGPPRVLAEGLPSLLAAEAYPYWFGAWAFSPDGRTLAVTSNGVVRLLETASGKERARLIGHGGDVSALAFSPDGRRLASGSRDTTILVWDVTGRLRDGRLKPAQPSPKEWEEVWADLAADDATRAARAIWVLVASPTQAVPLLARRLRPDSPLAPGTAARLVRNLGHDSFAVRVDAAKELEGYGVVAEPILRDELRKATSPEVRRTLERILAAADGQRKRPSGEVLRGLRAVEALEQIGSPQAQRLIEALAAGVPEGLLTREARVALERLKARK